MILPANRQPREALFAIAQVDAPRHDGTRPLILLPNPFYQCYARSRPRRRS